MSAQRNYSEESLLVEVLEGYSPWAPLKNQGFLLDYLEMHDGEDGAEGGVFWVSATRQSDGKSVNIVGQVANEHIAWEDLYDQAGVTIKGVAASLFEENFPLPNRWQLETLQHIEEDDDVLLKGTFIRDDEVVMVVGKDDSRYWMDVKNHLSRHRGFLNGTYLYAHSSKRERLKTLLAESEPVHEEPKSVFYKLTRVLNWISIGLAIIFAFVGLGVILGFVYIHTERYDYVAIGGLFLLVLTDMMVRLFQHHQLEGKHGNCYPK